MVRCAHIRHVFSSFLLSLLLLTLSAPPLRGNEARQGVVEVQEGGDRRRGGGERDKRIFSGDWDKEKKSTHAGGIPGGKGEEELEGDKNVVVYMPNKFYQENGGFVGEV